MPSPVATRSNAWVCGRWFDGTAGSNRARGMDASLLRVVCCQVEASATSRPLDQRDPTECVTLSAISCNNNFYTYCELVDRGQD
jgi:hypothetical protein